MATVDIRALVGKLNSYTKRMVEAAAGLCVTRGNYEVTIEHLLLECLEDSSSDIQQILRYYDIDVSRVKKAIQRAVDAIPAGNTRKPVFSRLLMELLEEAWLWSSIEKNARSIRSGSVFVTLLSRSNRYAMDDYYEELKSIPLETLKTSFNDVIAGSTESTLEEKVTEQTAEGAPAASGEKTALQQFAVNFTDQARSGKIDPVFGREREIRQMIDILARRRKNNPIVVGEPGVGKTAVVEGLALKIIQEDVPEVLRGVELYGLDIGLLQAGASVKGQFEQRLKAVISEVKSSVKPVIMFIDEAHTLIGAGGSAGGSDAANLLKPALARGELRTIAATTWSEYKKYFEKDAALARRFQLVKIEEPDIDSAVLIMRGLRENYELAHNVYVRDEAVIASAELSARYISGRQLPDKSVDLLDTACARVKISMSSKPEALDELQKQRASVERALTAVSRDLETGTVNLSDKIDEFKAQLSALNVDMGKIEARWQAEKTHVDRIVELRNTLNKDKLNALNDEADAKLSDSERHEITSVLRDEEKTLKALQAGSALINYEVTAEVIGKVVSDWTGIPVGDMVRDEAQAILNFEQKISQRIKGQQAAINTIAERIKAAKAGLSNPNTPLGVFLCVGPSGVGKTETGLGLADLLFGGERFVVTINMSEFQEKHTLSRLVGSPPGYVGYGEGGVLTEAVRQRPYSVVLLDEVEKADLEVMNLFYQVFDKGTLSDGEGRVIDFKNTIILLTSNLASDLITQLCSGDDWPTSEAILEAIRPILSDHFKPALLARMEVVPFLPIARDAMGDIVRIKLNKLAKRMLTNQKITLDYDDNVVQQIVNRCTEVETGARNIDYIVNKTLLPQIANNVLNNMAEESNAEVLALRIGDDGDFSFAFSQDEA